MKLQVLTGNSNKYKPLEGTLSQLGIDLRLEKIDLLEIQTRCSRESVLAKARQAQLEMGIPVLVDDVALYLNSFNNYPGPLVKHTLKGLGIEGIKALLDGKNKSATIICSLAITIDDEDFLWEGKLEGYIDTESEINDHKMLLSSIFKCNQGLPLGMRHRELAFNALSKDLLPIRAKLSGIDDGKIAHCDLRSVYHCVFCDEFDDIETSVFKDLVGDEIEQRVVYEDDDFIIIVPIGQFVEGGLLLLTKQHIPSFAHLPKNKFRDLELLIEKIKKSLTDIWGVTPIIFEHGPAVDKTKGKCCVDHAHFNIFPVNINVHPRLESRFPYPISALAELTHYKNVEEGYLYVDSPLSGKYIYDGNNVPSQLIRRYLTEMIGQPERWHWRHYMGINEMKKTLSKLRDFND